MEDELIEQDIISPINRDTPARVRVFMLHETLHCKISDCGTTIDLHDHIESYKEHIKKLTSLLNVIDKAIPKIKELGQLYEAKMKEKPPKIKVTPFGVPIRKAKRKTKKQPLKPQ